MLATPSRIMSMNTTSPRPQGPHPSPPPPEPAQSRTQIPFLRSTCLARIRCCRKSLIILRATGDSSELDAGDTGASAAASASANGRRGVARLKRPNAGTPPDDADSRSRGGLGVFSLPNTAATSSGRVERLRAGASEADLEWWCREGGWDWDWDEWDWRRAGTWTWDVFAYVVEAECAGA